MFSRSFFPSKATSSRQHYPGMAKLKPTGILILAVMSILLAALSLGPKPSSLKTLAYLKPGNTSTSTAKTIGSQHYAAFKEYVEMYGRQTPRGYDKWVDYATSRQCRLDKEAYAMMEDALAPFRENGPKTSMIRSVFKKLDSVGFISIRNGSVIVNGPINYSDFYFKKVSEFAVHVPDLDLIINLLDEPRVWWPEHLPPELEKQIQNGSLEVSEAFAQHGCQATDELKKWREVHAFVAFPQRGRAILHELAPVVSFSGIPGCFADFRMPSHYSIIAEGLSHHGLCAPSAQENLIPWDEKVSVV